MRAKLAGPAGKRGVTPLRWLILIAATLIAFVTSGVATGTNVDDLIFQGADFHYKNNLDAALSKFQEALRFDPANEYAHNQLGIIYAKKERYTDAFREFSTVVRIDGRNTFALVWLGILYLRQNEMDRAFETFQKVASIDPNNADAYYFIGSIYNFRNNTVKAIEYLKKARDADSDEPDTHYRLGRAFHNVDMVNNAFLEYYRALQLRPTYTKAINEVGWIYYNQGNYAAAVKEWEKTLRINPRDSDAVSNLAKVYNEMAFAALTKGDKAVAVTYWERALSVMPQNKAAKHYLEQYGR